LEHTQTLATTLSLNFRASRKLIQPSISILDNRLLDRALIRNGDILSFLVAARGAKAPIVIHSSLESIAFPTKDVVAVLAVPSVVSSAEIEGLGAVCWPVRFVVEFCGVPDDLKHELGDLNRVGRRAVGG